MRMPDAPASPAASPSHYGIRAPPAGRSPRSVCHGPRRPLLLEQRVQRHRLAATREGERRLDDIADQGFVLPGELLRQGTLIRRQLAGLVGAPEFGDLLHVGAD